MCGRVRSSVSTCIREVKSLRGGKGGGGGACVFPPPRLSLFFCMIVVSTWCIITTTLSPSFLVAGGERGGKKKKEKGIVTEKGETIYVWSAAERERERREGGGKMRAQGTRVCVCGRKGKEKRVGSTHRA